MMLKNSQPYALCVALCLLIFAAPLTQAAPQQEVPLIELKTYCQEDPEFYQRYALQCAQLLNQEGQAELGRQQSNTLQEMKNFLALSQLQQARAEAEWMFSPPPELDKTVTAGQEDKQARALTTPVKKVYESYFTDWNILALGREASDQQFVSRHLQEYCTAREEQAGLCYAQEGESGVSDLSASSLLDPVVLTESKQQNAASAYIRNLTNPVPVPLLPPKQLFKNQQKKILTDAGQENLAAKFRQQTLVSLAQDSYLNMLAERLPYDKGERSRLSVLEEEANRRFNNESWYASMGTLSTEALLREVANMTALRLAIEYRDSQRLERMEALMAAQVAIMAQLMGSGEQAKQASLPVNLPGAPS